MSVQYIIGYILCGILVAWSLITGTYEFILYAVVVLVLVMIIHRTDPLFHYPSWVLWAFVVWLVMHILGGLWVVGDEVLYNKVLIPIVGEPYLILKYDQLVHAYCYTVVTLLIWSVVSHIAGADARHGVLVLITVLAATGIGGLNEIVEFAATVLIPDTNVGGYENTAIDIVANLLGAIIAIPLLKRNREMAG